jgi:hypothetical protein
LRVSQGLRTQVARRSGLRCEYCLIHEDDTAFPHAVDHVISRQHGGETAPENLAYACMICNRFKGSNVGSVDGLGSFIRLFNPWTDEWEHHSRLDGAVIQPLTPAGEATARLLRLNVAERVIERTLLQRFDHYPRK